MTAQHFDAIIIGAGISGISAAYHLQKYCPAKSYKILERREQLGGTWDLFNYPGIRSDSDMYTFGFSFRPWADDKAIAEKGAIIDYLRETTEEYGIDKHIQYSSHVKTAAWHSDEGRWHIGTTDESGQQQTHYTCQHLFMCSGYYNYDQGYAPEFPGADDFQGQIIHPQQWPEDLDYSGKRVVVVGSGATAITLIPSMAQDAEHVTMLQRSPTYLGAKPAVDPVATKLARWFGRRAARWWFILHGMFIYAYCKKFPDKARAAMKGDIKEMLGDKYVDKHFSPDYDPWDQRVCLCPDGDFFDAIKQDKASIVTDHIDHFTENGIKLKSGDELQADIIVTATGLQMLFLGGIEVTVDNESMTPYDTFIYKGFMGSGTPNLYVATGYTNASWTLKVDLTNKHACRLINYMDRNGYQYCVPIADQNIEPAPLLNLDSGYIKRGEKGFPRQATEKPWKLNQNVILDNLALRYSPVTNPALKFH
ncbi:MAG: NAD(P)/FAD-dependent oxidoreductase [Gammaproteobacteria bacterium]|nr:NAD(P)/FAD-dependent oxidoreductase [Gammaproteobacteria bacterium]